MHITNSMSWCFALINNKLAEIFLDDEKKGINGYCYVDRNRYKTKKEQKWIETDTKIHQYSYRKNIYKRKDGVIFQSIPFETEISR